MQWSCICPPHLEVGTVGNCPLGVDCCQGERLIIDKRRRSQQQWQRRDDGGETTAARWRRRDDGGKAATAMKKKKPAADIAISILFIYICVRFLVIFAVLSSYLFPSVVFHLFHCLVQKFYFKRAPGHASFLTRIRFIFDACSLHFWRAFTSTAENLPKIQKSHFFIICEV